MIEQISNAIISSFIKINYKSKTLKFI
jgi:hypothetical protein